MKGKVGELVCYGEHMGKTGEAIDSYILTIFGIHGGRKLTLTLGLVPTDKEDLEQRQFEKTNGPEHKDEGRKEKSSYISPEEWGQLSQEEKA